MNDSIVKAQGLGKTYNNGTTSLEVLRDITLEIKEREFLSVQGPSGAGKSTLLHILGGLDSPTKGRVCFGRKDIYSLKENERAEFRNASVGFVFQFYHLLPEFSALENVLMPALLKSWGRKREASIYAGSLLERLGLSGRSSHRPNQLSGGEQQRVAIARSPINKPQLLLCDEPTGNLDSRSGENILQLLKQLNKEQETTVVLVTHNQEIAKAADRMIYLKDGMLVN